MQLARQAPTMQLARQAPTMHRRRLCSAAAQQLAVMDIPGKARSVVATAAIPPHTTVHVASPMAQVLKVRAASQHCDHCLTPTAAEERHGARCCSQTCLDAFARRGGDLLQRVDLAPLRRLHETQDRKFPLLIAEMLAGLLAEIKHTKALPSSWEPLELCFAELHSEAALQVETEHAQLVGAFVDAGLANTQTLELFLPLARYRRLLGAAQLNAFELTLSHGAVVSALLPGLASCFNHSCEPNVLIMCGETHEVAFVTGEEPVAPETELCISYIDLTMGRDERRELLLHKYGFECECARCQRGD